MTSCGLARLGEEAERQLANRGGIALAALLVVFALLLTFSSKGPWQAGILTGGGSSKMPSPFKYPLCVHCASVEGSAYGILSVLLPC